MCLYPKLIYNPKYKANKKNGGNIPELKDRRVMMVPVGCQKCMECKKQKARSWSIRLQEEIRGIKHGEAHFVTLTFSNESIKELHDTIQGLEGYELDNEIARKGLRRFLERWRKKYKVSIRHWLVTELGHNGTENIHMHGILFTQNKQDIQPIWKYGWVYIGDWVAEDTVNYCVKYSTKTDPKHKEYHAQILTSAGIGSKYITRLDAKINKYTPNGTKETYTTRDGKQINLPIYYRNKIYTDEEKEKLWIEKLNKNERWVDGTKIDVSRGTEQYYKSLKQAQKKNKRLGYSDDKINWDRIKYENERRKINMEKRLQTTCEIEQDDLYLWHRNKLKQKFSWKRQNKQKHQRRQKKNANQVQPMPSKA